MSNNMKDKVQDYIAETLVVRAVRWHGRNFGEVKKLDFTAKRTAASYSARLTVNGDNVPAGSYVIRDQRGKVSVMDEDDFNLYYRSHSKRHLSAAEWFREIEEAENE